MNLNLSKLCFCKAQMIKLKYKWSQCQCCCNDYDPNEMEFYWCGRRMKCDRVKIATTDYVICSKCFNKRYDGTYDSKNDDFISTKTKANIKIIS